MKIVLSCRSCNTPAGGTVQFIAVTALSFFLIAGIMPTSGHAQPPQADVPGRNALPVETRDGPAQTLFNQAASIEREDPERALVIYEQVMQRFGRATSPFSRLLAARALLNRGGIFGERGDAREAIFTYERIERNFGNERTPAIREVLASALVSKAETFYKQGNTERALATYAQLDQQFGRDDNDFTRRLVEITKWRMTEIQVASNMALSSSQ